MGSSGGSDTGILKELLQPGQREIINPLVGICATD
jgi:hypothetical protein